MLRGMTRAFLKASVLRVYHITATKDLLIARILYIREA